jgi:DNA-binding transcriptional LysR family regulator
MNVKVSHLQSFVTVAQLGSFTEAAKVLHISQPALTVQINQLEAALNNVRLLDRNTRSVQLTKVGKEVLPAAQRIIADLEKLVVIATKASRDKEQVVRVAAISSIAAAVLPPAITDFYQSTPGIFVQVTDAFADKVLSLVREEKVDFGIASLADVPSDVQVSFLFRDKLSVVFSNEPRLAKKKVIKLKDLIDLPLILMEAGTSNRAVLDRAFQSMNYFVKPRYEAARITTAVAMAEAGLGVAVLPSTLFKGKRPKGVQVKPIQEAMLTRDLGVIQKLGHSLPPEADKFLKFLKAHFKAS